MYTDIANRLYRIGMRLKRIGYSYEVIDIYERRVIERFDNLTQVEYWLNHEVEYYQ